MYPVDKVPRKVRIPYRKLYFRNCCRIAIEEQSFDMIFCDYRLGDMNGSELMEKMTILQPEAIVIFITGNAELQTAVDLVKAGAYNYLSKPLYPDELLKMIEAAFSDQGKAGSAKLPAEVLPLTSEHYITGESKDAKELYRNVSIVAPTNFSVIIYGETGTGKESLARLLHAGSVYAEGNFVAIDCGCLSKELAVSELFGHEKGSFTGLCKVRPALLSWPITALYSSTK